MHVSKMRELYENRNSMRERPKCAKMWELLQASMDMQVDGPVISALPSLDKNVTLFVNSGTG